MTKHLVSRLSLSAFALTLLAGSMVIGAAAPAQAQPACSTLVITGHPSYPPVAWAAQGKIVGAAPDLVSGIAARLGVKDVQSKDFGSWEAAQAAVKSGAADVIFGIYKNDVRAAYMDFVEPPFMVDPVAVVVRKGAGFAYAAWTDLKGRKGVTNAGESYGDTFDAYMAKELTVARAAGVDKAFAALLAGQADYMIIGLYPGRTEAKRLAIADKIDVPAQGAVVVGDVCRLLQAIQMRGAEGGLCRGDQDGGRWRGGGGSCWRRRRRGWGDRGRSALSHAAAGRGLIGRRTRRSRTINRIRADRTHSSHRLRMRCRIAFTDRMRASTPCGQRRDGDAEAMRRLAVARLQPAAARAMTERRHAEKIGHLPPRDAERQRRRLGRLRADPIDRALQRVEHFHARMARTRA